MKQLAQVVGSTLGRSIEKEIQHLCDIRDNCVQDDKIIVNTVKGVLPQILQRIHKLIQDHLPGCTFDLTSNEYYGFYAEIVSLRHDMTDILTDQGHRKPTLSPKTAVELIKVSEQYKIDEIVPYNYDDGNDKVVGFRFKLNIDFINTICCTNTINNQFQNFTAAELTAVILHEIGHILSFYRQLQFTKKSIDIQKDHFNYFFKNAPNEEKLKYIKYAADSKILESLPPDQKRSITESADLLGSIIDKVTSYAGDSLKSAFDFIIMFWYLLNCAVILMWIQGIVYDIINIYNTIYKISSQGDHDYAWTDRFYSDAERAADSWCAKNGYSVPLTTALMKTKAVFEYKMFNLMDVRSGVAKYYASKFVMFFINFATAPGFDYLESYEQGINRYKALQYENIHHLKNANIPDELAAMYISSIKDMDRQLDKMTYTKATTVCNNIIKTLRQALSPAKWAEHLTYGTMFTDLNNLAVDINKLQNNRLYASAAELKLMSK